MEIAVKVNIGKLELKVPHEELIKVSQQNGFNILPVSKEQINQCVNLPVFDDHKDPFDRFIIASAQYEKMSIVSDKKFTLYSS